MRVGGSFENPETTGVRVVINDPGLSLSLTVPARRIKLIITVQSAAMAKFTLNGLFGQPTQVAILFICHLATYSQERTYPDNPSVAASTGYPVCLPRVDPAVEDDPLCPRKNRPLNPSGKALTGL